MRDLRTLMEASRVEDVPDLGESADSNLQRDVEVRRLEIEREQRLKYLFRNRSEVEREILCQECHEPIAPVRIRAFDRDYSRDKYIAVPRRCKSCEDAFELESKSARRRES